MIYGKIEPVSELTGKLSTVYVYGTDHYYIDSSYDYEHLTTNTDIVTIGERFSALQGSTPLSFNSSGSSLDDYIIYGKAGGVGRLSKNLFDKDNADVRTVYPNLSTGQVIDGTSANAHSLVIPVSPGEYTFSIYHPPGEIIRNRLRVACYSSYPNAGANAVSTVYENNTIRDGNYVQMSFTAPAGSCYILVFLWTGSAYTSDVIAQSIANNRIMLEAGSSRGAYEPHYSGYSIPINVRGRNLLDKNSVSLTNNYPDPDTGELINDPSYGDKPKSVVLPVKPNTQYTIQIGLLTDAFLRVAEYTAYPQVGDTGTVLSASASGSDDNVSFATFTTGANAAYIVWYFSWNASAESLQSKLNSMMMETGPTMSGYEPFFNNTVYLAVDSPLGYGESISGSDSGVSIPVNTGSNIISAGTNVQPTVYIKYRS